MNILHEQKCSYIEINLASERMLKPLTFLLSNYPVEVESVYKGAHGISRSVGHQTFIQHFLHKPDRKKAVRVRLPAPLKHKNLHGVYCLFHPNRNKLWSRAALGRLKASTVATVTSIHISGWCHSVALASFKCACKSSPRHPLDLIIFPNLKTHSHIDISLHSAGFCTLTAF